MKKNTFSSSITYFLWIVFSLIILFIKLNYHELWKDEWQAWFVAKEKSVLDIISFLYYEGHPALWYFYLKIFTPFSSPENYETTISFAHWLVVVSFSYVFFVRFQLPVAMKILLSVSYFLFFEYSIINRGYALSILFLFLCVYLIKIGAPKKHLGVMLFLLCQTEIYGVFMAFSIAVFLIFSSKIEMKRLFCSDLLGLIVGVLVFLASIFPRDFQHLSAAKIKTLAPIDQFLMSVHGNLSYVFLVGSTPDVYANGWNIMGLLLSSLCFGLVFFVIRKNKPIVYSFVAYTAMCILFSAFIFVGGIRQWGMAFIFFIALLELSDFNYKKRVSSFGIVLLFCIFAFIHGYRAVSIDLCYPFSNSKIAGDFIKEKMPIRVPVVAINKFEAVPVIGYSERPFYELPTGESFYYFNWLEKTYFPTEAQLRMFARYKNVGGIAIISPKPLDKSTYPTVELWKSFDSFNYKRENYYLYLLSL